MTNPLYTIAKNAVFAPRRAKRAVDGATGCYVVAGAQTYNLGKAVCELDGKLGQGFKESAEAISKAAKASPGLAKTAGVLKWAGEHVNPLIVGEAVYTVFTTDKEHRVDKAIEKTAGVGSMFFFEKLFKKNDEIVGAMINKIPLKGKLALLKPVIKGLAFAATSIVGYDIGSKAGEQVIAIKNNIEGNQRYASQYYETA